VELDTVLHRSFDGFLVFLREGRLSRVTRPVVWWLGRVLQIARKHNLNPWVFLGMSVLGWIVQGMFYLSRLGGPEGELALLITLRLMALVVPAYILLRGRNIASVVNVSVVAGLAINTAWHVCYFVYL
jgi:hypothetical protein